MNGEFAGVTHPGRKHTDNEDVIGWTPVDGRFLVADGMGGHASGEVASRIVKETVLSGTDSLEVSVRAAHAAVVAAAQSDAALSGMGSTVVAVSIEGAECEVVWVGDSRAYLIHNRRLRPITRDHSLLELLRERESLSDEQLRNHPDRNVVTQTLGLADPTPSRERIRLESGDRILLCSDGLTDELTDQQIEAVFESGTGPEEIAEELVKQAVDEGGRDNVSVVVIEPEVPRRGLISRLLARVRLT